jgi:hypothetical protein
LVRFFQSLHDSGRPELEPGDGDLAGQVRMAGSDQAELRILTRLLGEWHAAAVLDLPGKALPFHEEAAVWGAVVLFRAAGLVCFREIAEADVRELFEGQILPGGGNAAAHFSADLCLRHWPAIYRMARARSEDDVLVKVMWGLAMKFPLSSLGMNLTGLSNRDLPDHAGLRQLFAERALERADTAGLAVPEIDALIRLKLGNHGATLGRGLLSSPPC